MTTYIKNLRLPRNKFILVAVFLAPLFLFFYSPSTTQAATLNFDADLENIYVGDTFVVDVILDSEGEEVNVVDATIIFSDDTLEVVDVSGGGSPIDLWPVEPNFSNEAGVVSFTGGITSGFNGTGVVMSITFRAGEEGLAHVSFQDNSQVLLNNGAGTQTALVLTPVNYQIVQRPRGLPTITSGTHPKQNRWYNSDVLAFGWPTGKGAVFSYALSRDPLAEPFAPSNAPIGEVRYESVGEGIFYFLLQQKLEGESEFGPRAVHRVMVDKTPPELFELEIIDLHGEKYVIFTTSDAISGVDHYELLKTKVEGAGIWRRAVSPYLLDEEALGGIIKVKAVDKAGNERVVEAREAFAPTPYDIFFLIIIAATLLFITWFVRNRKSPISPK